VPGCGLPRALLELAKVRLTAMIALTSGTGYVLATGRLDLGILRPLIGSFLLACGAAAWNQCQDAKFDARMGRTCGRPIPSGRIDRFPAALVGAILVLLGLYVLSHPLATAGATLALGVLAVLWYNAVYTPLKRKTAFAAVPGALLGAMGPMIGFSAGGGDPFDPDILLVGSFFFVWQILHFWLLVLRFGEQQAAAGLASPTRIFARPQLVRITFVWVCAVAAMGPVLLAAIDGRFHWPWALILLAGSAWLAPTSIRLLSRADDSTIFKRLFVRVNIYGCIVMLCLAGNALASAAPTLPFRP
jgi:protoheme IX farnesyltransferase